MKRLLTPASLAWLAIIAGSAGLIAWCTGLRVAHLERVSREAPVPALDAASPTGYTRATRGLLLPPGSTTSQPWIMDVQRLVEAQSWTLDRVNYDNAPEGRPAQGPFLYRWWLRIVALLEPGNGGLSVERAARHADPALQIVLCLSAGLLVWSRFGAAAGAMLSLGIAALLSHAQVFAPGQPDDHGLFLVLNLIGTLLLLIGWPTGPEKTSRTSWILAGVMHGLGFWLNAGSQLVALAALLAGGAAATMLSSREEKALELPWRPWAGTGALVAVVGWFFAGRPGGVTGAGLDSNHPLLGLAWIGAAELLTALGCLSRGDARHARLTAVGWLVALLAALGWLFYRGGWGTAFGPQPPALSASGGLWRWLRTDGLSVGLFAALSPLLFLPLAIGVLRAPRERRDLGMFSFTGAVVILLLAVFQLRWWGLLDMMLLCLLVPLVSAFRSGWSAIALRTGVTVLLVPALAAAWPRSDADETLAPTEARALVERDLAYWLAARSDAGIIAFAPPHLSGALCYYGGLRVIASPYPGNTEGLVLAARIAGTPSTDEAQAIIQRRGIQYIILPSWDDTLDQLARQGSATPERSLVALLRQWLPPRWLRPVAYPMPAIPGLEQDSLAVFEVVEPQDNALALSRLAEYFVETDRLNLAHAVADTLEKSFAADAGAMVARARVALAQGDSAALARTLLELLPAVADGRDEDLSWERRAQLAIVLAQTRHPDLARPQVTFCLREADSDRLRSLGPVSLFQLLSVAHAYALDFSDPQLRPLALELLPAEFRAQLAP